MTPAAEVEPAPDLPELVDVEALASRFKVTRQTIRRWVAEGVIPPPLKIGRRSVWTARRIAEFLDSGVPTR